MALLGVAKISTKVDQVADTFYVQDIFGQKIYDDLKINQLRMSMLESLEGAADVQDNKKQTQ